MSAWMRHLITVDFCTLCNRITSGSNRDHLQSHRHRAALNASAQADVGDIWIHKSVDYPFPVSPWQYECLSPVDQLGDVIAAYGPPTPFNIEVSEDGASSDDEDPSVAHLDDNGDLVDIDSNGKMVERLD